jgi:hypothetical protein
MGGIIQGLAFVSSLGIFKIVFKGEIRVDGEPGLPPPAIRVF